jgi:hypothetical protein
VEIKKALLLVILLPLLLLSCETAESGEEGKITLTVLNSPDTSSKFIYNIYDADDVDFSGAYPDPKSGTTPVIEGDFIISDTASFTSTLKDPNNSSVEYTFPTGEYAVLFTIDSLPVTIDLINMTGFETGDGGDGPKITVDGNSTLTIDYDSLVWKI